MTNKNLILKNQKGLTLISVLIATMLLGFFAIMVPQLLLTSRKSFQSSYMKSNYSQLQLNLIQAVKNPTNIRTLLANTYTGTAWTDLQACLNGDPNNGICKAEFQDRTQTPQPLVETAPFFYQTWGINGVMTGTSAAACAPGASDCLYRTSLTHQFSCTKNQCYTVKLILQTDNSVGHWTYDERVSRGVSPQDIQNGKQMVVPMSAMEITQNYKFLQQQPNCPAFIGVDPIHGGFLCRTTSFLNQCQTSISSLLSLDCTIPGSGSTAQGLGGSISPGSVVRPDNYNSNNNPIMITINLASFGSQTEYIYHADTGETEVHTTAIFDPTQDLVVLNCPVLGIIHQTYMAPDFDPSPPPPVGSGTGINLSIPLPTNSGPGIYQCTGYIAQIANINYIIGTAAELNLTVLPPPPPPGGGGGGSPPTTIPPTTLPPPPVNPIDIPSGDI